MSEKELNDLYVEYGYPSAARLYKVAHENGLKLSLKQINEFIASQPAKQLHFQPSKRKQESIPITTTNKQIEYQIDLLDMSKFYNTNRHYKWILIMIDIFTRKAWATPLKNKSAKETTDGITKLTKESGIPKEIASDDGKEWKGSFAKFLKTNNIIHKVHAIGDHRVLGIIDRFSKTIKNVLYKRFTQTDSTHWVDYLPKYIAAYNKIAHSSLCGSSPNDAEKYPSDTAKCLEANKLQRLKSVPKLNIGDVVRTRNLKKTFDRGYEVKYSTETHRIKGVEGVHYVLDNGKRYRINDLQRVPKASESVAKEPVAKAAKRDYRKEKELKRDDIKPENVVRPKRSPQNRAIMTDLGLLRLA